MSQLAKRLRLRQKLVYVTAAQAARDKQAYGFWSGALTIFSALEKILIVVGVPIAAYWTYFTFSTNDSQKARIKYETALARAKAFGLQIDVKADQSADHTRIIYGYVTIKNIGAQYVSVNKKNSSISIGAIEFSSGASHVARSFATPALDQADGKMKIAVAPQRIVTFPFAAQVCCAGYYLIKFSAPVSFLTDDGATPEKSWGERAIVQIK